MNDEELVARFEAGTLPPDECRHREHVQLAWAYLTRCGRAEAERRMLAGLRALAVRAGKPEKFDGPLTIAWIARIDAARDDATATFDAFAAARPDLLEASPLRATGSTGAPVTARRRAPP